MTDNIRLPDELGCQLRARREALGLSKSALAEKAGKVREVGRSRLLFNPTKMPMRAFPG